MIERRFVDPTSGVAGASADTVLPDAAQYTGQQILVANISATASLTVRPAGNQLIDKSDAGFALGATELALFFSDGVNWRALLGSSGAGGLPSHHGTHEAGGSDEILLDNMVGLLATPQTPTSHSINGGEHSFPGGATFLRADGVFAAPGGGPHSINGPEHTFPGGMNFLRGDGNFAFQDPLKGSYNPSSFTAETGRFVLIIKQLRHSGGDRITLEGDSRLNLID